MKSIKFDCPHCKAFQTLTLPNESQSEFSFDCLGCKKQILISRLAGKTISGCPVCGCKDLYQQKDFPKKLGIALFLIGAVFAPWTYYLSLIVALIIDAILYPFFGWMQICYKCFTETRGWEKSPDLDRFNHEIGAHYEYRSESVESKTKV